MSDGMQPLSVVIPVYNALGQVEGLLTRLSHFKQKYGDDLQVIVADDFSGDGTALAIQKRFDWVDVVANKQNRGFGINVMTGVAIARHPFLATLNSDIDLIGNPFKELIDALCRDKDLFAVMPLVYNRGLDKVENLARLYCHRGLCWHTELVEEEEWSSVIRGLMEQAGDIKSRLRDVGGNQPIPSVLCGAAFVCSRQRFLDLGGFDPYFQPFYWEDVDLDYRARRYDWYCGVLPTAAVLHRHSETIDRYHSQDKMQYWRINQLRFVINHQRLLPDLRVPRLWWVARAAKELLGGNTSVRRAYLKAGLGLKQV